jgi:cytochrome c553
MKTLLLAATALTLAATAGIGSALAADVPPPWAYGFATPPPATPPPAAAAAPAPPPPDNTVQHTLAGSKFSFTRAQAGNRFGPADWFPEDHPQMPDVVAHGRESASPQIFACGLCHYPNGRGRPENANVTGLSYDYIMQQLIDFKNGVRKTSDPRKGNTGLMAGFARSLTEQEMKEAARYFASIPAVSWIKVVETDTAPKARVQGGMFVTLAGNDAGTEPLGERILEVPVSTEDTELWRNSRSGFVAYVPPGSVKKGEALATAGTTASGGKVTACVACHGPDLRGLGPVPRLAGRSPSYLVRQLYDMQHGNRAGAWTPLMVPVVANLNETDLLNAAAYLASLQP